MKTTAIVFAVAASLGFGNLALAQGHDRRGPNDEPLIAQRHDNRVGNRVENRVQRRVDQRMDQRADRRFDQRFDQREERWNDRRTYYNARGPEFRRGGYIPREYRNPTYFITDYRPYHLPPPPRNHRWVQVGADFVLIAITTGIIASIVLGN